LTLKFNPILAWLRGLQGKLTLLLIFYISCFMFF